MNLIITSNYNYKVITNHKNYKVKNYSLKCYKHKY